MFVLILFNAIVIQLSLDGSGSSVDDGYRSLLYNGIEVKTTYKVDPKFIGTYSGSKTGYLVLNGNGSGSYLHDYFVKTGTPCSKGIVELEWGFIVDEEGEVVRFDRPYGYSYPIIFMSTGDISFQACTQKSMVDYLLVYRDGTITVSSSDDWVKRP